MVNICQNHLNELDIVYANNADAGVLKSIFESSDDGSELQVIFCYFVVFVLMIAHCLNWRNKVQFASGLSQEHS